MKYKDTNIDEISRIINKRVEEGIYSAGENHPSEIEFCDEFDISRDSIRGALRQLQSQNIIDIIPRSGAFVRAFSTKITIGVNEPSPNIAPSQ